MYFKTTINTGMPAEIVSKKVTSINVELGTNQTRPHWSRIRKDQVSLNTIGLEIDEYSLDLKYSRGRLTSSRNESSPVKSDSL